jgi:coproporphyrinogen III oxidase-like Fe-S oxidoreductase
LNKGIGGIEKTPLTPSEAALERLYMGLRLRDGLNRSVFQDLQNGGYIDLEAYQGLCAQGMMAEGRETVFLTDKGRLRLDGVVVDLIRL